MRLTVLLISILFFFGCGLKQESNSSYITKKDSETSINEKEDLNKELLTGVWGDDIDSNANFRIKNDSMYFLEEQNNPAPIQVIGDTLITDYGDGFVTTDKIYTLSNDSLVLINELGDTLRMVRIK